MFYMSAWMKDWLPFIYSCSKRLNPPSTIQLLDPYARQDVRAVCDQFYNKYYNDKKERSVILGINPGRLGAGITGISFTDPEKLENYCGIPNSFDKKEELSSRFIYAWITRTNSVREFYKQFIILSVCPLGFVAQGKNINYYDDRELTQKSEGLIVEQQDLLQAKCSVRKTAFMLGKGKNFKYFQRLNEKHKWYQQIVPLLHPRYVMQYKYKTRFTHMDEMMDQLYKGVENE